MARQLLSSFSKWLPKFVSAPSTSLTSTTVSDDLKMLDRLLNNIQADLRDAEDRENRESSVKLWLQELTDVAYDAEDVLLEYHYHVLHAQVVEAQAAEAAAAAETTPRKKQVDAGKEVNPFASGSNFSVGEVSMPHNMADRIRKIRERFDAISRDKAALELKPEDGEIRPDIVSEYPKETISMVDDRDVYGREDDKKALCDRLFSGSKFEVIAVYGKGGLGKTTLAQLVYNDPMVANYFQDMRIWIWVPQNCKLERLTELMIERITNSSCKSSDSSVLRESLRKSLQGKRVLLVLDDVWVNENEDMREPLRNLFQSAEMMKIIVTTRNCQDAKAMNPTMLYPLGHLLWEHCWQLFVTRAFGHGNPKDFPTLEKIGLDIVRKCDGLPLSVKSLGSLLRQYGTDEDAWKDVLESELWELEEENNILPALRLSYSRMPNNLRSCFEICSMFPKYHVFDKDELVKLWAAQGYVQPEDGKDAEEMGHKYFNELHWRSFFDEYEEEVDVEYEEYGKVRVKRYRMHDNIRDLASYVLEETNKKRMIRHLYYDTYDAEEFLTMNDTEAPRTLIVDGDLSTMKDIFLKLTSLTHLRYLGISVDWDFYDASDDEFLKFPERMGNLICLRHLKLDIGPKMSALESVGRLYNLVALEIRCQGLVEFPESMRNLVSLTNIYFRDFQNDQLPALGKLPSLRCLILKGLYGVTSIGNEFCRGVNNRHDVTVAFPSLTSLVFEHMPNWAKWDGLQDGDFPQLQKLEINHCELLSSLPPLIKDLLKGSFLQKLTTLKNSHDVGKLRLPQGFGELTKLESLSGKFWVKSDDLFGIFNNLMNLKYLTLENVRSALITQACLKGNYGVEKLMLKWDSSHNFDDYYEPLKIEEDKRDFTLCLVVERAHDNLQELEIEDCDSDDNPILEDPKLKNASFSILDNLQPHHANFQELEIEDYNGDRWPSWIGDPSFSKLTDVTFNGCRNVDRLPTLGQLPSLKYLSLSSIYRLKRIGNEFCRGINGRRDVAAFPSLIELKFSGIREWEEWDGVLDGDFPQLQKLAIEFCPVLSLIPDLGNISCLLHLRLYDCASIKLSSEGPLLPNLKTLTYESCGSTMHLPLEGKLIKLQRLRGEFVVVNHELFHILNNLSMNHEDLSLARLGNVGNVVKGKGVPELKLQVKNMALAWKTSGSTRFRLHHELRLVVGDNNSIADDKEICEINGPYNLLENLWPRTNLEYLEIQGYHGVAYPTWIGHPSFDKLTQVHLSKCEIGQLPPLGQLPSLEYLFLCSISRSKIIAHEFCRSTLFGPKVAFPCLTHLEFEKMNDWEEWYDYGVLHIDFPKLRELKILDCPKLSSLGALRNLSFLQELSISNCPVLQLSSVRSLPPNLRTFDHEGCGSRMCLPLGDKLLNRVSIRVQHFGVRKDELFGVLNKVDSRDLAIKGLGNVCKVFKVEDAPRVEILSLSWRASACTFCGVLIYNKLVICDNNFIAIDDGGSNAVEPSLLLENLQPDHTKLEYLNIEGYDSIGFRAGLVILLSTNSPKYISVAAKMNYSHH